VTPEIMKVALGQGAHRAAVSWGMNVITDRADHVRVGALHHHHQDRPGEDRDVIGKGGAVIRQITEETTTIDIRRRYCRHPPNAAGARRSRTSSSPPTSRSDTSTRARWRA
jgi:hypothetical protein